MTNASGEADAYGTYFLGRYRVVDEIGVGGMASVHLARMDGAGGFQKWVAIKRIHPHLIEDEQFIHMFLDEARIAARISHPNVAQVFDLGVHENTYWIAMEYLHGEPLREVMRFNEENSATTAPELAARIIADAAEGLHAAHELRGRDGDPLNLVHRDVSPHNLFLTYGGMVKVVDFGIAKVSGRLSTTRAGTLKGKLAYMSPEQVRGSAVDRRTDIFALGVVLWEMATGQRLFRADSDLETLEKVQACVVPPPSTVRPGLPDELESIIMRALQKRRELRYQTARELSRALQQHLMHAGQFVGPEEVGAYVTSLFADRIRKREDHLRWAAEVTQTISTEDLRQTDPPPSSADDISVVSHDDVPETRKDPQPSHSPVTLTMPGCPVSAPARLFSGPALGPAVGEQSRSSKRRPAHGIHMPAPRVAPEFASQPEHSVVITATPPAPPQYLDPTEVDYDCYDEEENIETIVVPSRAALHEQMAASEAATPEAHACRHPDGSGAEVPVGLADPAPVSATKSAFVPPGVTMSSALPFGGGDPEPDRLPTEVAPAGSPPGSATLRLTAVRQRFPAYFAAAVATFFIVVGIAAAILLRSHGGQTQPVALPTAPPTVTLATAQQRPTPAPPIAVGAAPPAPTATNAATGSAIPRSTASAKLTPPVTPTAAKAPPTSTRSAPPRTAASAPPTSARSARPRVSPPVTTTATVTTKAEPGFLTIVCSPFCDSVVAGGRNFGPSPVVHVPLPPGSYRVTLRRSGSSTKVFQATVVSGKTTSHRVSMD
ncbi:MAG: protein kinase [Polyangiaceae bacterium]|nr:protein kinase [Polyangiaceae bacterium]